MTARSRKQLLVLLSAVILLVLLTAITGLVALHVSTASTERAVRAFGDDVALVRALQRETQGLTAATRRRVVGTERGTDLAAARTAFLSASDRVRERGARRHAGSLAAIGRAAEKVDAVLGRWASAETGAAGEFEDELRPAIAALDTRSDGFVTLARAELDAALGHARRLAWRAELTLLLLALVGIAVVAGMVAAVARELELVSEHSGNPLGAAIELRRERHDAQALVAAAVQACRADADARAIRIHAECSPALVVYVDRARIIQVLSTLVVAALRASRLGSIVSVRVTPEPAAMRFAVVHTHEPLAPGEGGDLVAIDRCTRIVEAHRGRFDIEVQRDERTAWFTISSAPLLLP